jgi:hydrogenase nickel incorporation protein HypA/HybF
MHELSLIQDLLQKIEQVAQEHQATKVTGVAVRLGALTHLSPDHFREHFEEAVMGTVAEGASLEVEVDTDTEDPSAQDILLVSVDAEV